MVYITIANGYTEETMGMVVVDTNDQDEAVTIIQQALSVAGYQGLMGLSLTAYEMPPGVTAHPVELNRFYNLKEMNSMGFEMQMMPHHCKRGEA